MDWEATLGSAATCALVAYTCIGVPAQLLTNRKRRSTEGLSPWMVLLSWIAFVLFTGYGAVKPDWFVVVANAPGAVLLFLMLLQFVAYRQPAPGAER